MAHRFPIKEIARQAGLRLATVDRVLNNQNNVSLQTKLRETAAIEALTAKEAHLPARSRRLFFDFAMVRRDHFNHEVMLRALARARAWTSEMRKGKPMSEIVTATGHSESYIRTRSQLALLAPRIQLAILDGRQPPELTLEQIVRKPIPLDWKVQERLYGFEPNYALP